MMLQAKRNDSKNHINPHTGEIIKDVRREKERAVTVNIPESLHKKFKIKVVYEGEGATMSKKIKEMIEEYVQ